MRKSVVLKRALRALEARFTPFELDWIQVELSARCTADCVYCPVSRFRGRRRESFMSEETFRRIEPTFSSVDLVFLQGWGEPMMHPRFWEFVHRARDAGPRVGFTTNATLLDAENRHALLESGVEIMGVSLAGADKRTHDRFRVGNSLDLIDRHLSLLREEKHARGLDFPNVHLAYLLLAANLSELPDMMDLAGRWGASQVVVNNLDLVMNASLEVEALGSRPELWPELGSRLEEACERAEQTGIIFQGYGFDSYQAEPTCTENVLKSCFVSADGWVSPCVMANLGLKKGTEAHFRCRGGEYPIESLHFGNVHERSVEEIWRSEPARGFRNTFRERIWRGRRDTKGLPNVCTHCQKLNRVQSVENRSPREATRPKSYCG